MKYKAGDKFIIEIETHYNHSGEKNSARPLNDNDGANVSELYRIRGFKSLVFDADGLKKLEPLEDMTAEEYLNIKKYYCGKQFEKGWRVKDLPDWCLEDFRYPENSIKQIEHLRGEYKKAKCEAERMMDIRYDLEDVIAEYGIDDVRKALEQTEREERVMTNEEAKAFLDNLKICINEHPVVADWLVEIADRKTEPNCSEKPNNCEEWQDWKDRMWAEAIVTEPTISKMEQVDKDINVRSKDEPQTVRSNLEPFRVDEPQTEMPRCSVNGTPFDECGFCEYFNCDTCKCEADVPQTERKDK